MKTHFRRFISVLFATILLLAECTGITVSADWSKTDTGYSYIDGSGKVLTGWQTIGKTKYYFDKNGISASGWKKISGSSYYFISSKKGKMATGWLKIGSSRYYFGTDGKMRTGLKAIGGKTYYFGKDGKMRADVSIKLDGKTYKFGSDGAQIKETKKYTFRTDELYDSHYKKHGSEFGKITKEEYLALANELINSDSDKILKKVSDDGDDLFFHKDKGYFLVLSGDGYIRTFFIPNDGIKYWNRQ